MVLYHKWYNAGGSMPLNYIFQETAPGEIGQRTGWKGLKASVKQAVAEKCPLLFTLYMFV